MCTPPLNIVKNSLIFFVDFKRKIEFLLCFHGQKIDKFLLGFSGGNSPNLRCELMCLCSVSPEETSNLFAQFPPRKLDMFPPRKQ